jgi:hypothetical protein
MLSLVALGFSRFPARLDCPSADQTRPDQTRPQSGDRLGSVSERATRAGDDGNARLFCPDSGCAAAPAVAAPTRGNPTGAIRGQTTSPFGFVRDGTDSQDPEARQPEPNGAPALPSPSGIQSSHRA